MSKENCKNCNLQSKMYGVTDCCSACWGSGWVEKGSVNWDEFFNSPTPSTPTTILDIIFPVALGVLAASVYLLPFWFVMRSVK